MSKRTLQEQQDSFRGFPPVFATVVVMFVIGLIGVMNRAQSSGIEPSTQTATNASGDSTYTTTIAP